MIPVSNNRKDKRSGNIITSSEVIYTGCNDLPCVNTCPDPTLTDVLSQIGEIVCALNSGVGSISGINLGCLYSSTIVQYQCPTGYTFVPDATAPNPGGYCQICKGGGLISKGGSTSSTTSCYIPYPLVPPVAVTVPNPVPAPTTLVDVLNLIIAGFCSCCNSTNSTTSVNMLTT